MLEPPRQFLLGPALIEQRNAAGDLGNRDHAEINPVLVDPVESGHDPGIRLWVAHFGQHTGIE